MICSVSFARIGIKTIKQEIFFVRKIISIFCLFQENEFSYVDNNTVNLIAIELSLRFIGKIKRNFIKYVIINGTPLLKSAVRFGY